MSRNFGRMYHISLKIVVNYVICPNVFIIYGVWCLEKWYFFWIFRILIFNQCHPNILVISFRSNSCFCNLPTKFLHFSGKIFSRGGGVIPRPLAKGSEWKRFNPDKIFSGKSIKYKSFEENESHNAKEMKMMSDMRFCWDLNTDHWIQNPKCQPLHHRII